MAEFDDKLNALLSNPQAMEQIMQMAQSLTKSSAPAGEAPPPAPAAQGQGVPQSFPPTPAAPPPLPAAGAGETEGLLSGLGALDMGTIASLLPVLRALGGPQNSSARQLLLALRPYLKPERQDKVERALQLARLFRVGKQFLLKGDGHV